MHIALFNLFSLSIYYPYLHHQTVSLSERQPCRRSVICLAVTQSSSSISASKYHLYILSPVYSSTQISHVPACPLGSRLLPLYMIVYSCGRQGGEVCGESAVHHTEL